MKNGFIVLNLCLFKQCGFQFCPHYLMYLNLKKKFLVTMLNYDTRKSVLV